VSSFDDMPLIARAMQCSDSVPTTDELRGSIDDYILEPKFDGFRLVAQVGIGVVDFYTREGKKQNGKLPHIEKELLELWPAGTVLDGEITAMTAEDEEGHVKMNFEYVQSVMLSLPERAVEVQDKDRPLTYSIFDVMQVGDNDLRGETLLTRKGLLDEHHMILDWRHTTLAPIFPCQQYVVDACLEKGFEGCVAKKKSSLYGYTAKGWAKIKPQKLIDAVVLGFTEGEGKYTGQIGAMIFGQPREHGHASDDVVIDGVVYTVRGQCSGMTDDVRLTMTDHSSAMVGTVVEIKHHGLMHGGVKFRHPQFSRFRPDKPLHEVRWHDR
jgi:bifunctional non-homologous end joining protein LigD